MAAANIRQAITKAEDEVGALEEEAKRLGQVIKSKIDAVSKCGDGKTAALVAEAKGLINEHDVIQSQKIPAKNAEIAALESQLAALSPPAA
jgi:HAMP domain-containing protein